MKTDGFEVLKRAWLHVRRNRFLWPYAFFIALAGIGPQGFSLWAQSPIPRGMTGYSPIHQVGARITDFAHGNWVLWAVFIGLGIVVGLAVIAVGSFAQVAAIGGVAQIEAGGKGGFGEAFRWGRDHFRRYLVLLLAYVAVLALVAVPSVLFWWLLGSGDDGFFFPCAGGLILGLVFILVSILASIMMEISGRFLVLEDRGVLESARMAGTLIKDFHRDVLITWLYVAVVTIAGVFSMAILIAILGSPLSWIFTMANRHHNGFLIALSMLAFLIAWALAAALSAVFAITASAMWTILFAELQPDALLLQKGPGPKRTCITPLMSRSQHTGRAMKCALNRGGYPISLVAPATCRHLLPRRYYGIFLRGFSRPPGEVENPQGVRGLIRRPLRRHQIRYVLLKRCVVNCRNQ
ncbi:MAG: hypothetical protein KJ625_07680, partial [Actinobacteria bacterium]|nr:hypothetical protein [Actinomycetota bacterium]